MIARRYTGARITGTSIISHISCLSNASRQAADVLKASVAHTVLTLLEDVRVSEEIAFSAVEKAADYVPRWPFHFTIWLIVLWGLRLTNWKLLTGKERPVLENWVISEPFHYHIEWSDMAASVWVNYIFKTFFSLLLGCHPGSSHLMVILHGITNSLYRAAVLTVNHTCSSCSGNFHVSSLIL